MRSGGEEVEVEVEEGSEEMRTGAEHRRQEGGQQRPLQPSSFKRLPCPGQDAQAFIGQKREYGVGRRCPGTIGFRQDFGGQKHKR